MLRVRIKRHVLEQFPHIRHNNEERWPEAAGEEWHGQKPATAPKEDLAAAGWRVQKAAAALQEVLTAAGRGIIIDAHSLAQTKAKCLRPRLAPQLALPASGQMEPASYEK